MGEHVGIWTNARHQLCVFHLLRDVLAKVLDAVRRLRRAQARRARAGRQRRRGRPSKRQQVRRQRQGPTAKEKAAFVWKHRFPIVKRSAKLRKAEWENLGQLFGYLPELRPLWYFSQDLYRLLDNSQTLRVARWRYTLLRNNSQYQGVRELVEALDLPAGAKLSKGMAFVGQSAKRRVRTNNHVERMNRRLRFCEKVRYRWRKRKWVVRWLVLLLDVYWGQATAAATGGTDRKRRKRAPPEANSRGKRKAA